MSYPVGSKFVIGGETVLDLTGDTVSASNLLYGYTAHGSDGSTITGTVNHNEQSSVTVSSNTITVPAGLWLSDVHIHMTGWQWDNLNFTMGDVITEGATGYSID